MANNFSKEERVAFEQLVEGFQDACVISQTVNIYKTDQQMMERAGNVIWRPQPYIAVSYAGFDQTTNFDDYTQLSVPAVINTPRSVPFAFSPTELRDSLQEGRLVDAAKQKLSSDINRAVTDIVSNQGALFVKRTAAASGFDDVAEIENIMNEQGVKYEGRYLGLSTRAYNGLAGNLAASTRSFGNTKSDSAYEKAYVGRVASFETLKLDYANVKAAAAGGVGITVSTLVGGGNFWTPRATTVATTGETSNVDNRFQTITVSSTTNVAVGDAFTIANVFACHHITKQSTGNLKTFRVVGVPSGTTLVITPAIVSNQGGTDAEAQYQNVVITATSGTAAITFLNTATGTLNPFWVKDSIEILPGRIAVDSNGMDVLRATTSQGIEVVMSKQVDINTYKTKIRVDTLFGVVNKQPQMSGVIMFSQP